MLFGLSLVLSACGGSSEPPTEYMIKSDSESYIMGAQTTEQTTAASFTEAAVEETMAHTTAATGGGVSSTGMNYFVFRQTSNTYTDENGRDLLIESLTEPVFYSTDAGLSDWMNRLVNGIYVSDEAFGQDLLGFAKKELNEAGEAFYAYSHYVTMGIARHDSRIASLLSLSSSYSGGEHPSALQTAYNFDLPRQRVLKLEDVIIPERAQALTDLVRSEIEGKFSALGEGTLFDDYVATISNALNYGNMTSYWYFTEDGLTVFFNQYELGPYTSGIIKAEISYENLNGILLPEFFPEAYTGTVMNAYMAQSPNEDDWIYYVDFAEGETVYVSIDGKAEHIQFSEIFLTGETVVGESMLFSANQISDGATFALTGKLDDPNKLYALEYYDSSGGPYVLFVHQMKVYEELPKIGY